MLIPFPVSNLSFLVAFFLYLTDDIDDVFLYTYLHVNRKRIECVTKKNLAYVFFMVHYYRNRFRIHCR